MNYEEMSDTDKIIYDLFSSRWTDNIAKAGIDKMRAQLYKNLTNQIDGYWSGHTAYHIMVDGGFLIDDKPGEKKKLTRLGLLFMSKMKDAEK